MRRLAFSFPETKIIISTEATVEVFQIVRGSNVMLSNFFYIWKFCFSATSVISYRYQLMHSFQFGCALLVMKIYSCSKILNVN